MNQGQKIKRLEKGLFWQRMSMLVLMIGFVIMGWNQNRIINETNDVLDNHREAIEKNIEYLNTLTDEILELQESVSFLTMVFVNPEDFNYTINIEVEESEYVEIEYDSPIDDSQDGL